MDKIKCKRCGEREARFNEKRQMLFFCSPCVSEIKSQNKIEASTANRSNVNEVYRLKLRILFLSELQKIKPELFQEFENELTGKYKDEFGTDFSDFQDALTDKSFAESFSNEFCEFARLFVDWLDKWSLKDDWIVEFLLNKLAKKDVQIGRFNFSENMIALVNLPIEAFFLPPKFEFEFPGIESDIETEKEYRKRFDDAFKTARKIHFDLIKIAKSNFINFSIKQKHIKWLIDYYYFDKKTFKSIAEKSQLFHSGVDDETVRKAVHQIADELPFTL